MGRSSKNSDVVAVSAAASPVVESGGNKRYAEAETKIKLKLKKKRKVADSQFGKLVLCSEKQDFSCEKDSSSKDAENRLVPCSKKPNISKKEKSREEPENRLRLKPCGKKPAIGTSASSKKEKSREEPTASFARQVQSTGASKTVVTRNIPYTNRSDLIKFFEQAGEVVKDSFNDRCHKGKCFIEFATYEAAEKALELDGQYLCNRKIGVAPLVAKALKTLAAKNLSFSTTKYDLIKFFEQAGDIVDVRFSLDQNGGFNGNCHIEFATVEAATKAVELRGKYLLGRPVELGFARETIFIQGFDTNLKFDQVHSSLLELFSTCGRISWMLIPTFPCSGIARGFAFIEYFDSLDFRKALAMNGHKLGDSTLKVQDATPVELALTPPGGSMIPLPVRSGGVFNPSGGHFPVRGYGGAGIGKVGNIYHTPGKQIKFADD